MNYQDKKQLLCRYIELCIRLKCDYSHVLGKPLYELDFAAIDRFIERQIIEPFTQSLSFVMVGQSFRFDDSVTWWEMVGRSRPGFCIAFNKTTKKEEEFSYNTMVVIGE